MIDPTPGTPPGPDSPDRTGGTLYLYRGAAGAAFNGVPITFAKTPYGAWLAADIPAKALRKGANELVLPNCALPVDVDAAPETARKFSVQAVPTLLILDQGNVLSRQSGAAPPDVLLRWVDEALQKKADSAGAAR